MVARKLDLLQGSVVQAHVHGLWPHLTDLARWPEWFRDSSGRHGLARVTKLAVLPGTVDPLQPELGQRYHLEFTNGFEGDFQVTYWVEPAQISLGLVKGTAAKAGGVEGLIFDLDFFPQPDGTTKVWFGALVMLEPGAKVGLLSAWPKRTMRRWVQGFHRRIVAQGPALAKGVKTKKQMEAARAAEAPPQA